MNIESHETSATYQFAATYFVRLMNIHSNVSVCSRLFDYQDLAYFLIQRCEFWHMVEDRVLDWIFRNREVDKKRWDKYQFQLATTIVLDLVPLRG